MNSTLANKLFDDSLGLQPGASIRISCVSRADQDSTRAQLYRVRRNFEKSHSTSGVIIQRVTDDRGFAIIISLPAEPVIEHIGENGEATQLSFTQPHHSVATEQGRVAQLMRSDGYSEEDIASMLEGEIS